jgi:hypothetical protein
VTSSIIGDTPIFAGRVSSGQSEVKNFHLANGTPELNPTGFLYTRQEGEECSSMEVSGNKIRRLFCTGEILLSGHGYVKF